MEESIGHKKKKEIEDVVFDFSWKKEYEIGVFEIDAEHKMFLRTVERIYKAFTMKGDQHHLEKILQELYKYADFHFISEENIMRATNYPDLDSHHQEHSSLMEHLGELVVSFKVEYIDRDELINFLVSWFGEHTAGTDQRLGDYLNEIGYKGLE